jgi:DNA-binding NtrC family response regulator
MTVLITGETGTGKELFARAIHYNGKNKNSPFVDIACSALPETLLESELFGYEKGAFTDAKERKIGLFELAGDGSIFLDEIGDISLATQSKLLKVIEDRSMRRVGGVRDVPVRARVIAATSADLEAKMRSGEFRKDLFHRLKILPLELPPLRERKEDIPLLVNSFLGSFNKEYNRKIRGLTPHALQILMEHEWEGNVRELKHSIERAFLLEESDWITEHDFDFASAKARPVKRKVIINKPESLPPKEVDSLMLLIPLDHATLPEVQRMFAQKVLDHVGGHKVKAAKILGVSRPRLNRILKNAEDGSED